MPANRQSNNAKSLQMKLKDILKGILEAFSTSKKGLKDLDATIAKELRALWAGAASQYAVETGTDLINKIPSLAEMQTYLENAKFWFKAHLTNAGPRIKEQWRLFVPQYNTAIEPLVNVINELATKLSNWIIYEDGFKTDVETAAAGLTFAVTENIFSQGIRKFLGDTSVEKDKRFVRKAWDKAKPSELVQATFIMRGTIAFGLWAVMGRIALSAFGAILPSNFAILMTLPMAATLALLGAKKSFDTLTFAGFTYALYGKIATAAASEAEPVAGTSATSEQQQTPAHDPMQDFSKSVALVFSTLFGEEQPAVPAATATAANINNDGDRERNSALNAIIY